MDGKEIIDGLRVIGTGGGFALIGVLVTVYFTRQKGSADTELLANRLEHDKDLVRRKQQDDFQKQKDDFHLVQLKRFGDELIDCEHAKRVLLEFIRKSNDRLDPALLVQLIEADTSTEYRQIKKEMDEEAR